MIKKRIESARRKFERIKEVKPQTTYFSFLLNSLIFRSKSLIRDKWNRLLLRFYDPLTMTTFPCSIGDIMLERGRGIYNRQFVVTTRVLDIESFRINEDDSFSLQNKLTSQEGNKKSALSKAFLDLILSVDKKGYDTNSYLTVNNSLYLLDGTHRTALIIEKQIDTIQVRAMKRKCIASIESFDYLHSKLSGGELKQIKLRFRHINEKFIERGVCFGIWIDTDKQEDSAEIINLISPFVCLKRALYIKGANYLLNNVTIRTGFYYLFVPNKVEYVIAKGGYYSQYVRSIRDSLYAHFNTINQLPPVFYITDNCLEGQMIYKGVEKFIDREDPIED